MPPARLLAVLLSIASLAPVSARAGMLISEMCDPASNYQTDRFIEIYNSGPATVDLTGWKLVAIANLGLPGTTNPEPVTWNLFGTIAPGEAKVAGYTMPITVFPVHFASAIWHVNTTGQGSYNWNGSTGDGAKLLNASNTIVDYAAMTVASTFSDKTYVRNPGVTSGNVTYTSSEWTATAVTLATNATPGTHNGGTPPAGVPVISNVVTLPASPQLNDPVHVQASVVDTVAAITTVTLTWGTGATPPYPNSIPMSVLSGSTYQTSAQIPAPAPGVTVYYQVSATDAAANTKSSTPQSFSAPQVLTIAQIQGTGATSPYAGVSAITSGVVTSVFGTIYTIQDGVGARNGMWVRAAGAAPAIGDVVTVQGAVTESDAFGLAQNTLLNGAVISSSTPGGTLPTPETVTTAQAITEPYEGVLVKVVGAECTSSNPGSTWVVNDLSGPATIDRLGGYAYAPVVTSSYNVTGTVMFSSSSFKIEPRTDADITLAGDASAPTIVSVGEMSDSTLLVFFSEPVDEASAETPSRYTVGALTAVNAVRDPANPSQVMVTIRNIPPGARTLTATGVADVALNSATRTRGFTWIDVYPPAGYYDGVIGLTGTALRQALHNLIDGHTNVGYGGALTAFELTDLKPNGKVWDMYSDIPGGTPPYEYNFGIGAGGGGAEGLGYNREHSFPDSWFNGGSPMHSDLWILYPTDTRVNNYRGNDPYGEVDFPTTTSQNGSKLGPNVSPGYGGIVFEPIDPYKGDLIRSHFYVLTRYYGETGGWTGSASVPAGAELATWARDLYLQWSANDPVSWKERMRNGAIYTYYQFNRNPFVDHPEFVSLVFDPNAPVSVETPRPLTVELRASAPNPFTDRTTVTFDLPRRESASLRVFDVTGRVVRTLASGEMEAGTHRAVWDGRNDGGATVEAGLYFYRLDAGTVSATRRVAFVR